MFYNNLFSFSKSSNAKIFAINYYCVERIVVNPNVMIRMNHVRRVPSQWMLSVIADEVRKLSLVRTKIKFIRVEPSVASYWVVEITIAIWFVILAIVASVNCRHRLWNRVFVANRKSRQKNVLHVSTQFQVVAQYVPKNLFAVINVQLSVTLALTVRLVLSQLKSAVFVKGKRWQWIVANTIWTRL